jgi:beta-galactosidase/beta-glucuronidase
LLGEHRDGFTPFELAVPAGALRASNELLIQVSDWRSALAPEAAQGQVSDPWELVDALIYPIGSQQYQLGIWQDVALVAYPEVRIKDVFVQTSVRNSEIVLEITLENLTGSNQSVTLSNDVLEGDQIVLAFAPVEVFLGSGEIKTMRLEQSWTTPHLWSPDDPYLYNVRSHLAGGDERFVRFGFREFWAAGNEFYLNGTRIHLRATATHPFAFSKQDALHYLQQAKAGNNVIMRLHAQPWPSSWYEAADEVGMLIVWESAYWCYGQGYWLGDDRFWNHFREHLHDQILLQRNHPSVVIWSLENELLLTNSGDQRLQANEARLAGLVGFAKSLDPTRPIMFEGDADPGGQADIINLHYPHEYPVWNLWPNEAWWLEFTNQTDIYPGEISGWPLQKPLDRKSVV